MIASAAPSTKETAKKVHVAKAVKSPRKRRTWEPDAKDHQVFQWVKFEGKTQQWAAYQLGISQPTVSRIIDRYERWQAHADPREGGRLDPAERLRAQRWLTYERNELILASALRIADRMEGTTEMSKSVRTRPLREFFSEGTEIRSEEKTIDRHGVAARFLRLAFRINMEQLKLVEADPPPVPPELSAKEAAEVERLDAEIAAELAEAESRAEARAAEMMRGHEATGQEPHDREPALASQAGPAQQPVHDVNNLNDAVGGDSSASEAPAATSADSVPQENNEDDACTAAAIAPCWPYAPGGHGGASETPALALAPS